MPNRIANKNSKDSVLLVEDNPGQLQTIKDILEGDNFEVICCETGREAISTCKKLVINVAILDLRLADVGGLEVLRELKRCNPEIKVIINTAYACLDSAMVAINEEAFGYIQKMGDVQQLLTQVHRAFHEHFNGYSDRLEREVEKRTKELVLANKRLRKEMADKRRAKIEREKLEDLLRHPRKMETVGTLAGGIAHDLNNILTPILGNCELAQRHTPKNNRAHIALDRIMSASMRAQALIAQILSFSRPTENDRRPVKLHRVVKEALALVKSTFAATIKIVDRTDVDCGTVLADPTQIHQIIMNLCTNAKQALPMDKGTIEITLKPTTIEEEPEISQIPLAKGQYIQLSVRDNGRGMGKETVERIFEPFFTTKKKGTGTGLGLSVVHGIVNSHGGVITIDSVPGKGTIFEILFPRTKREAIKEEPEELCQITGEGCILLVDDEIDITSMAKELLDDLGYSTITKTDSNEALREFKRKKDQIDVVIADYSMPNLTGLELSRELIRIRPDLPIIMTTGFNESVTKENFKKLGIKEFIPKPFRISHLDLAIRRVLHSSEPQQNLAEV